MRTLIVGSVIALLSVLGAPASIAAPASTGSTGSIAIAVPSSPPAGQRPGGRTDYDITVSCALPDGATCGPAAVITLPVPAALHTWEFRATSPTDGLLAGPTQIEPTGADDGPDQVRIPLSDSAFVGGTTATVHLSVASPRTATATRWALRPTLSSAALGTLTAPQPAAGALVAQKATTAQSKARVVAAAAPEQTAEITIDPADQTHATGTPQTYTVNLSCQGTDDARCGPNATVTIPLDTTTTPSMTDGWTYNAVSNPGGLLVGNVQVVNGQLVMHVNDSIFVGGFSGSITLQVTPPNNITPNNTSWSLTPTLTGDNITTVTAPVPASSVATATPQPSVSKVTSDGGSVYQAGGTIGYTINAQCSSANSGNLFLEKGSLVDLLPPGVTFVSSTPSSGTYDAASNTVTWTFPDGASTPAGCGAGSTGTNTYRVVVQAPTPAPPSGQQPLTNKVTFSGTGPDAKNPAGITRTTSAQAPVAIVDQPPTGPGAGYATISKTSLAPIPQPGVSGNQYIATYPGNWLPSSATPGYNVGAAAGSFRTTINYGLVGRYQTHVIDPVPCLDNQNGNEYTSAAYNGSPCANPAFHTRVIQVYSPGHDSPTVGAALAAGWRPGAVLTDGTRVTLSATGNPGSGTNAVYFSIPAADVGKVAAIDVPPSSSLENHTLQLTMWGYADASLGDLHQGINKLTNVVTAIPQLDGRVLTPVQARAAIFTVPPHPQLGISKSFGRPGAGPNGSTVLSIEGSVNLPDIPLTHDVVLTDLLPLGLRWNNPVTSGSFTLSQGSGAVTRTVTATVQDLQNYQGSGRELIRMRIPASAFTSAGSWTITPPTNFLLLTTPRTLGVYPNTDQIFLYNLGTQQILPQCSTPTQVNGGTSTAAFESADPQDLAGDGNDSEQFCQNSASLQITGNGAAFALVKTVQGDQDAVSKGAGGIGIASHAGSGVYRLRWDNVGSDDLNNAVVYDILPYVGDTGVSRGQANVHRNSRFQPIFDSVGALPAGVTVQYSQSNNPCRNEVYVNTANTGCVSDWTSTEPDPSAVRALRFMSSNTYSSGEGFAVSIKVNIAAADSDNKVAWNSSATNASDVTNPGNHPLPAEPPKVGLVAPSTPTLATSTSDPTATAFGQISDTVTIGDTGGAPGRLEWSLVGPVAPVAGSCDSVDWSAAPTAASGSVDVTGDGDVTTGPASLKGAGCYSWADTLTGTDYPYRATSAAGAAGEVTLAQPFGPQLVTTVTSSVSGGTESVTDGVTVSGIPAGATAPSPLSWSVHGPVDPVNGTCPTDSSLYAAAPEVDSGTVPVTGNGDYTTPSVALPGAGCFSYRDSLPSTNDSTPAVVDFGDPAETTLVTAPTLTTATSDDQVTSFDSISDTLTAGGLGDGSGSIAWSLVGPVAPADGSCADLDWTNAQTVDSGTIQITDGSFDPDTVGPVQVTAVGCYSWVETVTGDTFPGSLRVPAGTAGEITQVTPYQPEIITTANTIVDGDGAQSVTDRITLSGIPSGATAGTLTWTLYGPVAANDDGSCTSAPGAYTAAGVVDTDTIDVTGNGSYNTPAIALAQAGCYSYGSVLSSTDTGAVAVQPPGDPLETVPAVAPILTTQTSRTAATPGDSVTDAVTIAGTHGGTGTLTWSLVGPVAAQQKSCDDVSWASARTVAEGTTSISGDGTVTVGPVTLPAVGCYSWVESLSGTFPSSANSAAGSPGEVLLVTNSSGVAGQSGHHGNSSGSGNGGSGNGGSGAEGAGVGAPADTGTDVAQLLAIALAALLAGVGVLLVGRRRRTA